LGTHERSEESDHLPELRLKEEEKGEDKSVSPHKHTRGRTTYPVVREDLQLSVKVQRKEEKSRPSGRRVTRRHRLDTVVDLVLVASADGTVEHDVLVAGANGGGVDDCEEEGS
jgi:hypothetical protein